MMPTRIGAITMDWKRPCRTGLGNATWRRECNEEKAYLQGMSDVVSIRVQSDSRIGAAPLVSKVELHDLHSLD
jgi:hypothetical protein